MRAILDHILTILAMSAIMVKYGKSRGKCHNNIRCPKSPREDESASKMSDKAHAHLYNGRKAIPCVPTLRYRKPDITNKYKTFVNHKAFESAQQYVLEKLVNNSRER